MSIDQLFAVDVDTERFVAITGIALAFALYTRTRLVTGGTITPAYFVILALNGRFTAIIVTIAVALVALVLVRFFLLQRVALSRAWLSGSLILTGALVNAVVDFLARGATGPFFGVQQLILVLGLYVTPGLIAYDWERQGFWKTNSAILVVAISTLALTTPVLWLAKRLVPGTSAVVIEGVGRIPEELWWLASVLAVVSTLLLRFGFGWRSAGFVGGLFVFEALTPITFTLAVLFATATMLVVQGLSRITVLTPRQRFEVSLVLGALASWFGLYWFTRIGYEPAIIANGFALEPLLIVGLMASDMAKSDSSVPRTIVGTVASAGLVGGGVLLAATGALGLIAAGVLAAVAIGASLIVGVRQMRRQASEASTLGEQVRQDYERRVSGLDSARSTPAQSSG